MGKASDTGRNAGLRCKVALVPAAASVGLAVLASAAWAAAEPAPSPAEIVLAEARIDHQPPRLQVEASALPRLETNDSGFQAPRVDVSLFPPGGPSGVGAVLGMSTPRTGVQAYGVNPPGTSVDLGVRWSQRLNSQQQIDVTAWRRMTMDQDAYSLIQRQQQPVYGARVELKLAGGPSSTAFAVDTGFIGLQLQSGARISIKRKNGGPMVYYRTSF